MLISKHVQWHITSCIDLALCQSLLSSLKYECHIIKPHIKMGTPKKTPNSNYYTGMYILAKGVHTHARTHTHTFLQRSGQTEFSQLRFHGMCELSKWSLGAHHLFRGNEPWPCMVLLTEALEPFQHFRLVSIGKEEANTTLQFLRINSQ